MYDVTGHIDRTGDGVWAVCTVCLPVAPTVVFDSVASGEGISSWFVPCALEPHVGGRVIQFADPGAPDPTHGPEAAVEASLSATVGTIDEITPVDESGQAVFSYTEHHWMGEQIPVPPWTTEFTIRPGQDEPDHTGHGATVLTVRSGFAQGGTLVDSAAQESLTGWTDALHVLAHRLTHRPDAGVVTVLAATDPTTGSVTDLWATAVGHLTPVAAPHSGADDSPTAPAVPLEAGNVVRSAEVGGVVLAQSEASLTVTLSAPCDGVVQIFAFPAGDSASDATDRAALAIRVYEYVDRPGSTGEAVGAAAVDDCAPSWDSEQWRTWLAKLARHTA